MKSDKEILDEVIALVDESSVDYVHKENIVFLIRRIIDERDELYERLNNILSNIEEMRNG